MRAPISCFALVVTLLAAPTVRAQNADPSLDSEGRALFEAGRTAYDAGRFADALLHFKGAYQRSGRVELLYNVGLAADRAGETDQAIVAFERYLDASPDAGNREFVESRLRILRQARGGAPEEGPPARARGPGIGPWIALGGGALILGASAIFFALRNDALGSCSTDGPIGLCDTPEDVARADGEGRTFNTLTNVALVAGSAILLAGVIWLIVGYTADGADEGAVALGPGPGDLGLSLGGAL